MTTIINEIFDLLNDDMVSYGILAQCLERTNDHNALPHERVMKILQELLASGRVEMGNAKLVTPKYVEFIAWKGTVDERVGRAMEAVSKTCNSDIEFAFWLCLRKNVDRFEGDNKR